MRICVFISLVCISYTFTDYILANLSKHITYLKYFYFSIPTLIVHSAFYCLDVNDFPCSCHEFVWAILRYTQINKLIHKICHNKSRNRNSWKLRESRYFRVLKCTDYMQLFKHLPIKLCILILCMLTNRKNVSISPNFLETFLEMKTFASTEVKPRNQAHYRLQNNVSFTNKLGIWKNL